MSENLSVAATKKTGSAKARMTAARLFAVQAVYGALSLGKRPMELRDEYLTHHRGMDLTGGDHDVGGEAAFMVTPDEAHFTSILAGVDGRFDELVGFLLTYIPNLAEKELLLKSILLCGAYELLAHPDIDRALVISEYLHITKGFFDGPQVKLVNGVLDKLGTET